MIYSCSWPDYQLENGIQVRNDIVGKPYFGKLYFIFSAQPNYTFIGTHCNVWRNFDDIDDSWTSVTSIMDYYGDNQDTLIPVAGPGHWNDPDMVFNLIYFSLLI